MDAVTSASDPGSPRPDEGAPDAASARGAAATGRDGSGADDRSPGAPAATRPGEPSPERLSLRTQLVRFVLTGGLSAIVDYGLLVAGMALGLSHAPAKAISWVFGTLTAYLINSRWTFQSDGNRRTLAAVAVLYLLTFALQVGTFALIYPLLESWWGVGVAQFVGFVIAQGLATTVNFIVPRTLIFT